jgi:uncharacterized membrane protein
MGFFGAVFVAMTLAWQWHITGAALALPFAGFAVLGLLAIFLLRSPGVGVVPSPQARRAIMWSSIGEGIAMFVGANLVINLHRPEWLLPTCALVVGLHFLPIAYAAPFRPLYGLAGVLILGAATGFALPAPMGGEIAGLIAAAGLWTASALALRRDWRARLDERARIF